MGVIGLVALVVLVIQGIGLFVHVMSTPDGQPAEVRLAVSGSGARQTGPFTTSGPWELHYTLDCANTEVREGAGGIEIALFEDENRKAAVVDDHGDHLDKRVRRTEAGTFTLAVRAPCPWTIQVTGP